MTLTVGIILTSYLCCNLPAMVVVLLDPTGNLVPQVPGASTPPPAQAHPPTLLLLWLSGVVNPLVYVLFNPLYRFEETVGYDSTGAAGRPSESAPCGCWPAAGGSPHTANPDIQLFNLLPVSY
jgi:hypothetical protein